jgi:hypothetical protein
MVKNKGHQMRVIRDFGLVRVISTGLDPRVTGSDINVEFRDSATDDWQFYCGFNSFTDDSSYTNALEAAGRAIAVIAARKAAAFA